MRNLEEEKKELLAYCLPKLEERMKNMKKSPVGTVRKWGNREFVKVESGWVPLISSKNTGC